MDANSTATAAQTGASGGSAARWRGRKAWRFVLALVVFIASTYWALNRENRADPFESIRFLSWKWWSNPLEVNAPARLPMVSGTLTSMDISGNGSKVYVAGQAGLLVRYDAYSQKWERIVVADSLKNPLPAAPVSAKKD